MPRESWFSPYPRFTRGSDAAVEALANADIEIGHMDTILSDLKEKRKQARMSAVGAGKGTNSLHSDYLTIVENQRRAEMELNGLRMERLSLVVIADLAYNPEKRGDYFPHPSVEDKAKEMIAKVNSRLLATSTVAFFGSGITFSTIFSGTRGSIGLMAFSWAAFSFSFTICVYEQWANPENLPMAIVAYPGRRSGRHFSTLVAGASSFVGIVLMGVAVAMLDLSKDGSVTQVDTRINTMWGGIISLLPVVLGFGWGTGNMWYNGMRGKMIQSQRSKV